MYKYGTRKKTTAAAKRKTKAAAKKKPTRSYVPYKPVTVSVGRQTFPLQYKAVLKYAQYQLLNFGAGNTVFQFSCNSLYSPNASYAGTQPLYFDQVMAIYDHYTVVSSKCKTTLCPYYFYGRGGLLYPYWVYRRRHGYGSYV